MGANASKTDTEIMTKVATNMMQETIQQIRNITKNNAKNQQIQKGGLDIVVNGGKYEDLNFNWSMVQNNVQGLYTTIKEAVQNAQTAGNETEVLSQINQTLKSQAKAFGANVSKTNASIKTDVATNIAQSVVTDILNQVENNLDNLQEMDNTVHFVGNNAELKGLNANWECEQFSDQTTANEQATKTQSDQAATNKTATDNKADQEVSLKSGVNLGLLLGGGFLGFILLIIIIVIIKKLVSSNGNKNIEKEIKKLAQLKEAEEKSKEKEGKGKWLQYQTSAGRLSYGGYGGGYNSYYNNYYGGTDSKDAKGIIKTITGFIGSIASGVNQLLNDF